jgi:hypothetical protein
MPNKTNAIHFLMFFTIAILAGSCKKSCSSITCHTYGYIPSLGINNQREVCFNGYCGCPNGYEGDSCQILSAVKFLQPSSTWSASDQCSGSANYYVNFFSNSGNNTGINVLYISGILNNGGTPMEVDIVSDNNHKGNTLSIPAQTIGSFSINPSIGTYTPNGSIGRVVLNLDYTDANGEHNCTINLYQQ